MNNAMPFGPTDEIMIVDEFSSIDFNPGECEPQPLHNIKKFLNVSAQNKDFKYLGICVPCYNEDLGDLIKTFLSILENIEFMKKVRMHDDALGKSLKDEYRNIVPIIVPIFDGVKALAPSTKVWLARNFENIFSGLSAEDYDPSTHLYDPSQSRSFELRDQDPESGDIAVQVRIACKKWWHCFNEHAPSDIAQPSEKDELAESLKNSFEFFVCPIVKRENHRKHNSQQWFFSSICESLDNTMDYTFLTDCGTTFEMNCIAKMMQQLYFKPDLIAVTGRQKVEMPGEFFHPCKQSILKGDHSKNTKPCWKCWCACITSPVYLQGFEYEFNQLMSYSMYNITETLPSVPGPCQLLDWQKIREYNVVADYRNLLQRGEAPSKLPRSMPKNYIRMNMKDLGGVDSNIESTTMSPINSPQKSNSRKSSGPFTFDKAVRANMRLASDRVLNFAAGFSTGFGTKWVPEATYYYTPEVRWGKMLLQRRRWINGALASFMLYFNSKRARSRVREGMFDQHKVGRSMMLTDTMWTLQIMQAAQIFLAPALLCTLAYIGIGYAQKLAPSLMMFEDYTGGYNLGLVWSILFIISYVVWSLQSLVSAKGKFSEFFCSFFVMISFLFLAPLYISIFQLAVSGSIGLVHFLAVLPIIVPAALNFFMDPFSSLGYVLLFPWFMAFGTFSLAYAPTYALARLWDTTWGNRNTTPDRSLNSNAITIMKNWNFKLVVSSIFVNVACAAILTVFVNLGKAAEITFMALLVFPAVAQLALSSFMILVAVPFRAFTRRSNIPIRETMPNSSMNLASSSQSVNFSHARYAGKITTTVPSSGETHHTGISLHSKVEPRSVQVPNENKYGYDNIAALSSVSDSSDFGKTTQQRMQWGNTRSIADRN